MRERRRRENNVDIAVSPPCFFRAVERLSIVGRMEEEEEEELEGNK